MESINSGNRLDATGQPRVACDGRKLANRPQRCPRGFIFLSHAGDAALADSTRTLASTINQLPELQVHAITESHRTSARLVRRIMTGTADHCGHEATPDHCRCITPNESPFVPQMKKALIDAHMNIATELLGKIRERSIDSYYALEVRVKHRLFGTAPAPRTARARALVWARTQTGQMHSRLGPSNQLGSCGF